MVLKEAKTASDNAVKFFSKIF